MGDRPLRADAQRNRDALVAKAREVINSGGFDMRFDDFARVAGVGTGTLYRHFPTREALIEAVYRGEIATLCEHAAHLQATLLPGEALPTFLRDMVQHMYEHEGLARTLATLMTTSVSAIAEGTRQLEAAVAGLVDAAAQAGELRADIGPGAILIALHGIGASHDRPNWRADTDGLITALMDGLLSPAAEHTQLGHAAAQRTNQRSS